MYLRYNDAQRQWIARHTSKEDFLATSSAPKTSLLLGSHSWTIHNDSQECSGSRSYTTNLTLSPCGEEQFTCHDGECVDMQQRCDSRTDCRDGSDEVDCRKVSMDKGYSKSLTPGSTDEEKVNVDMTISIDDILRIDEINEEFVAKITMVREWVDYRLTFLNLKRDSSFLNTMTSEEENSTWFPRVEINNIENHNKFKRTSIADITKVIPNKEFEFQTGDVSQEKNVQLFKGSENKIMVRKQWSVTFICHYNTLMYPFDTQVCKMEFLSFYPSMHLNPVRIIFNQNISLNRYFVRNISMCSSTIANKPAVYVEVKLGRPLVSNILTIFIPTTILTAISFMVRLFAKDFPDMVVEVNLTVLLVQATL